MGRLYKRKVELLVGKLGGKGVSIKDLRVKFTIDMDDSKETNTANLEIYNISQEMVGIIEEKNSSVILKVGYEDDENLAILYIGDIVEYEPEINGVDTITKITLKDGYIPLTKRKLSLSFKEGSNTKQILNKIISDLNLTDGGYSDLPNFEYKQGFSFIGSPGRALDIVLSRIGYKWTIVNNSLIITKPYETNNSSIVKFLSPQTGLLNSPKKFKQRVVNSQDEGDKLTNGWSIDSLIIPSIVPKSLIRVESRDVNGTFLVRSVTFDGDTHSSNWLCKIKAIKK